MKKSAGMPLNSLHNFSTVCQLQTLNLLTSIENIDKIDFEKIFTTLCLHKIQVNIVKSMLTFPTAEI